MISVQLFLVVLVSLVLGVLLICIGTALIPHMSSTWGLVLAIGVLVGLEIPLVMRILKRELAFKDLVSQVLTFDYLGALAVSILFPLVLAPQLGMVRSAPR